MNPDPPSATPAPTGGMAVSAERIVAAPVAEVFAIFSDVAGCEPRLSGVTRIEMLSPPEAPAGVGTRWRETRLMHGSEGTETMWITVFDPPRRYVVEAESHGAHYWTSFDFEPCETGEARDATRVTMRFRGVGRTLFARIMSRLMGPLVRGPVRRMLERDMDDLKTWIETGRG